MSFVKNIYFKEIVRPLRTTFSTALGQKDILRSIIVSVALRDGSSGTGECPTSFTIKEETMSAIKGIIREVAPELKNRHIDEYRDTMERCRKVYPRNPMTISGIEVALFRSFLSHQGITEHSYFGGSLTKLETDITIPYTTDFDALRKWMEFAFRKKFTAYKLKVSGNIDEDKRLISEACRILKDRIDNFTIRLDGNQGFSEKTCLAFLDLITKNDYRIELFEQPLPKDDFKGLKEIKKRSSVPIILDETVFNGADLDYAIKEDLCHGINIKIAKSGIIKSLGLLGEAKKHGLKLMIGCMTETMIGLSTGINLAAGTGGFDYIDLDAIHFLHHKNSYERITICGAQYLINKVAK